MTFQSFLSESWMDTHGIVGEFSLLLSRCHQMDLTSGCHTVPCHCAYAQNLLTAKLQTQTQGQKQLSRPLCRPLQLSPSPGTSHGNS